MKRLLIGLSLLLVLVACSKGIGNLTATELLSRGEKALIDKKFEQAVSYFEKAIELEPRNTQGYTSLANAYLGLGDMDKAIQTLQTGVKKVPSDTLFLMDVVGMYEEILDQDSGNVKAYTGLADTYIELGRKEKAITVLRKGLEKTDSTKIENMLEDLSGIDSDSDWQWGLSSSAPAPSSGIEPSNWPETDERSDLKIAIVTSPSGVDDGSYNQDNYNGILDFTSEYKGATVTPVKEVDIADSVAAVEAIAADYDVIVTPGYQFAGITQFAKDNPTKKFILVDSYPETDDNSDVPNIYAMQFKEQESGFLVGIAAALQTRTGKVAVVNGIAYPSNVNYQYGFEAGVNYANAKLSTDAEIVEIPSRAGTDVTGTNVGGNYTGSFDDETVGKVVGNELIAQGVDIIFVAAGGAGNGVFTAAKEDGNTFIIGYDVDQWADGDNNGKNIILTSALKMMRLNVYRSLVKIQRNTFRGENALLGADTDSVGYVSTPGHHQLTANSMKAMDDALAAMKNGRIVPPSNFSGTIPEDFPGLY